MALRLGELVAIISADDSRFHKTLNKVHAGLAKVGKAGALLALAGAGAQVAASLGPAAAGAFSLAAGLAAALAPAAGIAVALPAAAVAWKTALAIMSLAVDGFADTLSSAVAGDGEKFHKMLKAMPPQMRAVASELGGALFGLQKQVQNSFFAPIAAEAKHLGRQLRVPIWNGASIAAAGLGRFGARVVRVAREGRSIRFMSNVFRVIAATADRAGHGVAPLVRGLRDLAGFGLTKLPGVGDAIGDVAARMGRWLQTIVRTGQAARWFGRAVQVLQQLGRIAGNVGRFIGAVFSAAAAGTGDLLLSVERVTRAMAQWAQSGRGRAALLAFFHRGRQDLNQLARIAGNLGRALGGIFKNAGTGQADFLASLEKVTARFATWVNSTKGQQQIGQTFAMLNQISHDLMTILPGLVVVLGQIAGFITSLPAPVRGVVSQMLAWAVIIGVVSGKFGPLILGIGKTAGAVGRMSRALRSSESGVGRWARRIGRGFASAGRAAGRAARSATVAAGRFALAAGRMAASAALAAGRVVARYTVMAIQALIQGAKAAMFWILANWPLVLFVAAVATAVFLIIKYWDNIVAFFTKTLPHWIKVGLDWVVGIIKKAAKLGFLGPIGLIIGHWGKIKDFFTKTLPSAVASGIRTVTHWLSGLPGRVLRAVGDMGRLLVNAGKNLLIGLWNGIVSMGSWLSRQLGNLIRSIVPGPVLRVLGIHSPSTLFAGYGRNVVEGMALGINKNAGMVSKAAARLGEAAKAGGATVPAAAQPGTLARTGAGAGTRPGGRPEPARVIVDFRNVPAGLRKELRKMVRTSGRSDVQFTFG